MQKELHLKLLELLYNAHSGHVGSCLSALDILSQLFVYELRPQDKFILSKGHAVPALYVVLNYLGIISKKELKTYHAEGTRLPAHPPNFFKKHIHFPTGSLGHGLSLASGMAQAIAFKTTTKDVPFVYVLMSDGECNEGQVWEAAQYASSKHIKNVIAIIDKNGIQALGKTKDVLGDSASSQKWEAFDFEVYECDGHDLKDLAKAFKSAQRSKSNQPKMILANTVKGHGVSYMEHTVDWHYNRMTDELYAQAVKEIEQKYA